MTSIDRRQRLVESAAFEYEGGAAIHSQDEGPVDLDDALLVDRRDEKIEVAMQHLHHVGVARDDYDIAETDGITPPRGNLCPRRAASAGSVGPASSDAKSPFEPGGVAISSDAPMLGIHAPPPYAAGAAARGPRWSHVKVMEGPV